MQLLQHEPCQIEEVKFLQWVMMTPEATPRFLPVPRRQMLVKTATSRAKEIASDPGRELAESREIRGAPAG
jgi:hypothetical protein